MSRIVFGSGHKCTFNKRLQHITTHKVSNENNENINNTNIPQETTVTKTITKTTTTVTEPTITTVTKTVSKQIIMTEKPIPVPQQPVLQEKQSNDDNNTHDNNHTNDNNVLLIVDTKGWAWDIKAHYIKKYLPQYNIDIVYTKDEPKYDPSYHNYTNYNVIHSFNWMFNIENVTNDEFINYTCGVSSHSFEFDSKIIKNFDNYKGISCVSPLIYNRLECSKINSRLYHCFNGVDTELFKPIRSKKHLDKLVVGWVGQDCKGKGFDWHGICILNKIKKYYENSKDVMFVVHTAKYNSPNKIRFEDMPEAIYSKIDIMIHTGLSTGTPNPIFEAAACGKYLISTDIGCISELITSNTYGTIIPISESNRRGNIKDNDIENIANQFIEAINTFTYFDYRSFFTDFSNIIYEHVKHNWSWEHRAYQWIPIFEDFKTYDSNFILNTQQNKITSKNHFYHKYPAFNMHYIINANNTLVSRSEDFCYLYRKIIKNNCKMQFKQTPLKISISHKPTYSAYGGGNNFIWYMDRFLKSRGINVQYTLDNNDIDIILLINPIGKQGKIDVYALDEALDYKKNINKNVKIILRVNNTSIARHSTVFTDERVLDAIQKVDHNIFVSNWCYDYYKKVGYCNDNYDIIISGVDTKLFMFNKKYDDINKLDQIKLVTHHCSTNNNKGKSTYEYIINNIHKYDNITFTYIGDCDFESNDKVNVIKLCDRYKISKELQNHNMYISASKFESCPMHILEALSAKLPVVYNRNLGGGTEIIYKYGAGVLYRDVEDIFDKILMINETYKQYRSKIKRDIIDYNNIFEKYYILFHKMIN